MGFEILRLPRNNGSLAATKRQAATIGEIEQLRLDRALLRQAVALKFDIKSIAENALQRREPRARLLRAPCRRAARSSAPPGPPVRQMRSAPSDCEIVERQHGRGARLRREIGARGEPHQIAVAGLGFGEQRQIGEPVVARPDRSGDLASAKSMASCTPGMGWMPALAAFSENSRAPNRLFVSVIASAAWPSFSASAMTRASVSAPSRKRIGGVEVEVDETRVRRQPWELVRARGLR